jgi:hypothetical protein
LAQVGIADIAAAAATLDPETGAILTVVPGAAQ